MDCERLAVVDDACLPNTDMVIVSDMTMAKSLDMAPASLTAPSTIALIESAPSDPSVLSVRNALIALTVDQGHLLGPGEAHRLESEPEHPPRWTTTDTSQIEIVTGHPADAPGVPGVSEETDRVSGRLTGPPLGEIAGDDLGRGPEALQGGHHRLPRGAAPSDAAARLRDDSRPDGT